MFWLRNKKKHLFLLLTPLKKRPVYYIKFLFVAEENWSDESATMALTLPPPHSTFYNIHFIYTMLT